MADSLLLQLMLELKDEASRGFQTAGHAAADYNRQVQGATESNGGLFSGIGGGLAKFGMMATGVGAVASTVTGLASSMIEGNATMEGYATQFEVLTGSVENAGRLMEDLKAMGARTPFEFTDLAAGTQTLLAFGRTQEEVLGDLQMLGDISGGNAERMKSLSLVFGQVASNGKLMGGDLLQMINVGFNPLQIIADKTGQSMGDLRKEMEKGNISFEMVQDAMRTATSEGGQFFGMMEKQSGTFNGLTSTMADNFGSLQRAVMEPIFDVAKESLQGIVAFLGDPATMEAATAFAEMLSQGIGGAVEFIGQIIDAVGPQIGQLIGFITSLLAPTEGAKGAMDSFGQTFATLNQAATENLNNLMAIVTAVLTPIQEFFQENGAEIMTTVQGWMSQLGPLANDLLTPIQEIAGTIFGNIATFLEAHGEDIKNILSMAWETIKVVIDGVITIIRDVIIPAFQNIASFLSEHSTEIQGVLGGAWTLIEGIIRGAMEIIQGIVQTATSLLKGDWQGAWDGIQQIVQGAWTLIQGVVQGGIDIVKNILIMAWDLIKGKVEEIWNGITTGIQNAWTEITTAVQTNIDEVKNALASNLEEIKTAWDSAWQGVKDFATKLWDDLQTAVTTAFDNIKTTIGGFLDGVWNTLTGIGSGIVDGITQGIANAGDAIKNKLMEMAQNAWDAVTDFLGIHSPSTKGIWAGEMLGGSFGIGVGNEIPGVVKKVTELASGAMDALRVQAPPVGDLVTAGAMTNNTSNNFGVGSITVVVNAGAGADGDAIGAAATRALSRELGKRQRVRGKLS